jgi:hypothetical protein
MTTTTDIFCQESELTAESCMKNAIDNQIDYGLADAKAFDRALADNTPYNHEFYTKNKACLLNFVSYYESCKQSYKHSNEIKSIPGCTIVFDEDGNRTQKPADDK